MKTSNLLLALPLALLALAPVAAFDGTLPEPNPQFELCPFTRPDEARALVTNLRIARVKQEDGRTLVRVRGRARRGRNAPRANLRLQVCLRRGTEVVGTADEKVLNLRVRNQAVNAELALDGAEPGQQVRITVRALATTRDGGSYDSGDLSAHTFTWSGRLGEDGPNQVPGDLPEPEDPPTVACRAGDAFDYAAEGLTATEVEPGIFFLEGSVRNVSQYAGNQGAVEFRVNHADLGLAVQPIGEWGFAPIGCGETRVFRGRIDVRNFQAGSTFQLRFRHTVEDVRGENDFVWTGFRIGGSENQARPTEITLASVNADLEATIQTGPGGDHPTRDEGEGPDLVDPRVRFRFTANVTGQLTGAPQEVSLLLGDAQGRPFGNTRATVLPVGGSFQYRFDVEAPESLSCGDTFEGRITALLTAEGDFGPSASQEFSVLADCSDLGPYAD